MNKEKYVEITVVKKIRIPINQNISKCEFEEMLEDGTFFDYEDIFDFDNEEVIAEDYSYAAHEALLVNDKGVFKHRTQYGIGTLYNKVNLIKV